MEKEDLREQFQEFLKVLQALEKFGILLDDDNSGETLGDDEENPGETRQQRPDDPGETRQQRPEEEKPLLIPRKTFRKIFEIEDDSDLELYREKLNEHIQIVHPTIQCCKKTKDIWVQNIGRIKGVKFLKAFKHLLHSDVALSKYNVELYPTKHEIVKRVLEFIMRQNKKEFQVLRYLQDLREDAHCLMCKKNGVVKYPF